jgi:hypothetical protein
MSVVVLDASRRSRIHGLTLSRLMPRNLLGYNFGPLNQRDLDICCVEGVHCSRSRDRRLGAPNEWMIGMQGREGTNQAKKSDCYEECKNCFENGYTRDLALDPFDRRRRASGDILQQGAYGGALRGSGYDGRAHTVNGELMGEPTGAW